MISAQADGLAFRGGRFRIQVGRGDWPKFALFKDDGEAGGHPADPAQSKRRQASEAAGIPDPALQPAD